MSPSVIYGNKIQTKILSHKFDFLGVSSSVIYGKKIQSNFTKELIIATYFVSTSRANQMWYSLYFHISHSLNLTFTTSLSNCNVWRHNWRKFSKNNFWILFPKMTLADGSKCCQYWLSIFLTGGLWRWISREICRIFSNVKCHAVRALAIILLQDRVASEMAFLGYTMCRVRLWIIVWWLLSPPLEVSKLVYP